MRCFFWRDGRVKESVETDRIDIHTKRYVIAISLGGIRITRKARPKRGLEAEIRYDHAYKFF